MCVGAGLDSPWSRGAFPGISPQLLSASGMEKKKQFKCSLNKVTTAKFCFKGWKAPYPLNTSRHVDSCDLQRPLGAPAHHVAAHQRSVRGAWSTNTEYAGATGSSQGSEPVPREQIFPC